VKSERDISGNMLHYELSGTEGAPWLVFVHGAGGSIKTWKFQLEAFAPHFRLLLLDLRDHGYSKDIKPAQETYDFEIIANDILKVVDHLQIQKAHFLSLSIGSVILQQIDISRPNLIDRMVMAGAIFDGSTFMHLFVHSGKILTYILPFRVFYSIFSFIVLPRRNHRLSRYVFQKQSMRMNVKEYLKWVELYKPFFKLTKQYVNRFLETKCLVIMGDQDHIFYSSARSFAHNQKNAQFLKIKGCGHIVSIEAPKLFNQNSIFFLLGMEIPKSVSATPVPYKWSELKALNESNKK
jgi:pimeloyl-ACP methyl ester carboxylesterase